MNKELTEHLVPIIEKTKEGILKGIEVAQEQCPEIIEQLLAWKFIESILGTGIAITAVFLGILSVKIGIKKGGLVEWRDEEALRFVPFLILGVSSSVIGSLAILVPGIPNWVQILVAPKIYLLEYISGLLSK